MAECTEARLTITQDVANAIIEVDADIAFTAFDKNTNLGYNVWFSLIGDDTGFDAETEGPDDELQAPPTSRFFVRADGRDTLTLEWRPSPIAYADLDEDSWFAQEEEIRARVSVVPFNPVTTQRESNFVELPEINP